MNEIMELQEEIMTHEVMDLLAQKKYSKIKKMLIEMNEVDIAGILEQIENKENMMIIFKLLPKDLAAEVFAYVDGEIQESIIEAFSDIEISAIINELYADDAVELLTELPANLVEKVLKNAKKEQREAINKILSYPESSAGSMMTTEFLDLKKHFTVKQAFDRIRKIGNDMETINICYVTSASRKLEGVITVRELLLADLDETLEQHMETNVIFVKTSDDKEHVAEMLSKYSLHTLPVVDSEEKLVGIVTFDDAIEVIHEEATEDIQKMAAIQPTEEEYLKTPVFTLAKSRIVWLVILMFSAMLTGSLLAQYEAAFTVMPVLVTFIPMLMDTGGNCGAQASAMLIRGMALNQIKLKDFFKVFLKEFSVSLIVGFALSIVTMIRIFLQYQDILLGITLGITLYFVVIIAKFLGFSLPMLAKKIKVDPALMSSPLITTLVDAASIIIYFNIAMLLLPIA